MFLFTNFHPNGVFKQLLNFNQQIFLKRQLSWGCVFQCVKYTPLYLLKVSTITKNSIFIGTLWTKKWIQYSLRIKTKSIAKKDGTPEKFLKRHSTYLLNLNLKLLFWLQEDILSIFLPLSGATAPGFINVFFLSTQIFAMYHSFFENF